MSQRPPSADEPVPTPWRERIEELARNLESARAEIRDLSENHYKLLRRLAAFETASVGAAALPQTAANADVSPASPASGATTVDSTSSTALPLSSERLRELADVVPQIIWTNDPNGPALYFNRRWYEYTGLTYEQSAGPGWQAVVHPEDAPASNQRWQRALAAGEIFDAEYRMRRADGVYRWFIGRNVPLRDPAGRIITWFGTATDIQDLKEAQLATQEREEQFRRAIEDAPIPVIMQAEDGKVLQLNRAWSQLTGYTPQDLPTLESWLTQAYGPGGDAVRECMKQIFNGVHVTGPVEFEIVTQSGGHRHWLFSASMPGTLPDGRRYAVGMAIDLTDRKRAEAALAVSQERLRLIVEGAVEHAILSMDLQRRITSWNTGAERMFGYRREEILLQAADQLFTPEDRAAGGSEHETAIALAHGRAADERWHVRKDGSRFWGSGVTLPLHERPGDPATGFIKILRDETAQREASIALEESRKDLMTALHDTDIARAQAEAATRAKDHFLAVLSHELRTPLTPVLMAAATLSRHKDLPEPVRDALGMIKRNVQLEAQLVDDLLDVSRIVHGKMELERAPIDLHEVIQRAIQVVQPDLERKNQRLSVALEAERSHLTGDATRLQQVIWNLLGNASKFSSEGGEVRVRTRNEAGSLLVEVSDYGIGIEPAAAARIFEAFAQANVTITREFRGLGLGLSISKATVDAHGGQLRVESAGPGQGSTFIVSLPLPSGE